MPLPFIAALIGAVSSTAAAAGAAVTAAGAAAAGAAASAGAAVAGVAAAGVAAAGSTSAALAYLAVGLTILKKLDEAWERGFKAGQVAASKEQEEKFLLSDRAIRRKLANAEEMKSWKSEEREKWLGQLGYNLGELEGYCHKNNIKDGELIEIMNYQRKLIEDIKARAKANNR